MVLVDDSIVRGTTSRKIVRMVRAAGAREVHVRISCPPTISPCFYGVDTPSRADLIAATHTLDEIRTYLGADSVAYLRLEGLLSAVDKDRRSYCTSCYTGRYPVEFPRDEASYLQLALKLEDQLVDHIRADGIQARCRLIVQHDVRPQRDQFPCERANAVGIVPAPANVDARVAADRPSRFLQPLQERRIAFLQLWIIRSPSR